MRFDGKVVLVTGASRGIGREVCRQFAAAGATVVVSTAAAGRAWRWIVAAAACRTLDAPVWASGWDPSAAATHGIDASAPPMPSAIARAPTLPMLVRASGRPLARLTL